MEAIHANCCFIRSIHSSLFDIQRRIAKRPQTDSTLLVIIITFITLDTKNVRFCVRPDTRLVVHQSLRQSLEQLKALVSNVLFLGAPQIYVSLSRSEDLITINVAHADICEVATSFWKTKCFGTLKVLSMWGSAGLDLQKILGEQQGRRGWWSDNDII